MAIHLRDLGAHDIIDYTLQPIIEQVAAAYAHGIDAILDLVSTRPDDAARVAALLRPGGGFVSTNYAADVDALAKLGIQAVNLGNKPTPDDLKALAAQVVAGKLRVHIDAEVRLTDAPAAITRARTGNARGKTVIIP
jgi:NADPH:quinone reductase-like Zn-dependent oxidoreductase